MNQIRSKKNNWKSALAVTCVLVLSACGGGGGGGSDAAAPAAPATPGNSAPPASGNSTTITGAVTKGPVSGATLSLFEMDSFGQTIGPAVATGTTTADGNFSITVPANSGDLLVIASGGSFIDESDENPDVAQKRRIQLGANDTFLSVLPQGQTAVAVTPITTALVVRGRILGGPDGSFLNKFNTSLGVLNAQAGFNVLTTIPANPVAPAATATDAQKQYALLLGGIANLINKVAISAGASKPTYTMVVAVTFDLIDGQFDGRYFGNVNIPNNTQTPIQLPQDLDFTAEVNRFRNNNFDQYGELALPSIEVSTFVNTPPTSNAGADLTVAQNTQGQLDGTASSDAETGLFYSWSQTAGTTVTLSSTTVASPTFTAPTRLIGNETLTFTLTAIDSNGLAATDTVDVQVIGGIPAKIVLVDLNEPGPGIGVDFDGGGVVTFNPDGTGSILDDTGTAGFTYTVSGLTTTLTLDTPFLVDDFDQAFDVDGDGDFDDNFLVEERVNTFEFTLVTDNPNGDSISLVENGTRSFTPISADDTKPSEPYQFIDPITAFDPVQATAFSFADGARRTLPVNAIPILPTLLEDEGLYPDIFTFNANLTGSTLNTGLTFTYAIAADGTLSVNFSNGESAKYTNLITRPNGDLVAVEYNLNTAFAVGDDTFIGEIALSVPENAAVPKPTTLAQAAGIYTGRFFDEEIDVANLSLRLNPDGTGSLNFDSIASRFFLYDFDDVIEFRSNFGVCWSIDANSNIVVNRALSLNTFPNTFSSETTPSFCSDLAESDIGFQLNLTQLDTDGTVYKHFDKRFDDCSQGVTPDCTTTPGRSLTELQHRITTRVPLTATPPVAAIDDAQTPDSTPVVIDLIANDIARDLAIDPTSVQLGRGPFFGSVSLNAANGQVTYTPNAGITQDVFQYTVSDTAGNPSQVQTVEIVINPCAEINGSRGFYDRFTGDCDYSGLTGPSNVVTADLNLGPLPMGGVHRFDDSLFIGEDYATDAALAAAGITQGGDGPSLNLAPDTVLTFNSSISVISIRRGAQINVNGTPTAPVIMTSQNDIDSQRDIADGGAGFQSFDQVGDWGGLLIHGFGVTNGCTYTGAVSTSDLALSGGCHLISDTAVATYGGANNTDSSGSINYLQIKHTGGEVNGELSGGLGLFATGSGTSVSNVQVYSSAGDGIQLIGGAPNVQNYVGLYVQDASLGIDEGYRGSISNALLIQEQFSGNDCVVASGIVNAESLMPAQVDALVTQGINSRPNMTNVTCVISAQSFDSGRGFNFFNGAFGTLVDSVVTVPGIDDNASLNYCIGAEDRSLQGVQDLELTISSNIFACPDPTDGEVLPNMTALDAFLSAAGSQFSTSLTPGNPNPPPVAGTANVLLEGAPLIYSPIQANLVVDSSPAAVSPAGTFIGAVQQGGNDWTMNWTFGLHPGLRQVPLWYETPIVVAPGFLRASKGQSVTLDASQSVSAAGPLTYQWIQTDGDPVTLSDPTAPAPSFTAPGAGTNLTAPGGAFEFSVEATDANGVTGFGPTVRVEVDASIPAEFFSVAESIIPFQFNRTIEGGQKIVVNSDNTGTYFDSAGAHNFNWTDTPTTFTIDFSGSGGLVTGPFTEFRDVSASPGQEEVSVTITTNSVEYTLVSDSGPKKVFSTTETGVEQVFNVTDSIQLPDTTFNNSATATNEAVVATDAAQPLPIAPGDVRILPVDLSTANPMLSNPNLLKGDELTFNGDGTGTSRKKAEPFSYFFDGNKLIVSFVGGDSAEYSKLFDSTSGDAIGVSYVKANSDLSVVAVGSIKNDPGTNWSAATVAGIYTTNFRDTLNDGTFVNTNTFYRLHPEGTGQLELEIIDPTNGQVIDIFASSNGICWQIDANGDLEISRTMASDQRFTGSQVPGLSHCGLLNTASPDNTLINFKRINRLLDNPSGTRLRTHVENFVNQCNLPGAMMTCDNTLLAFTDTFQRIFDPVTQFNGNPPLAVPDAITASSGLLAGSPVHSNDLAGDTAIVPTSVTIVLGPKNGTATVDGPTGDILYTSNGGFTGTDTVYYRVNDTNGNSSTIGVLTINVF